MPPIQSKNLPLETQTSNKVSIKTNIIPIITIQTITNSMMVSIAFIYSKVYCLQQYVTGNTPAKNTLLSSCFIGGCLNDSCAISHSTHDPRLPVDRPMSHGSTHRQACPRMLPPPFQQKGIRVNNNQNRLTDMDCWQMSENENGSASDFDALECCSPTHAQTPTCVPHMSHTFE